jgi:hypothetical protein
MTTVIEALVGRWLLHKKLPSIRLSKIARPQPVLTALSIVN